MLIGYVSSKNDMEPLGITSDVRGSNKIERWRTLSIARNVTEPKVICIENVNNKVVDRACRE